MAIGKSPFSIGNTSSTGPFFHVSLPEGKPPVNVSWKSLRPFFGKQELSDTSRLYLRCITLRASGDGLALCEPTLRVEGGKLRFCVGENELKIPRQSMGGCGHLPYIYHRNQP